MKTRAVVAKTGRTPLGKKGEGQAQPDADAGDSAKGWAKGAGDEKVVAAGYRHARRQFGRAGGRNDAHDAGHHIGKDGGRSGQRDSQPRQQKMPAPIIVPAPMVSAAQKPSSR